MLCLHFVVGGAVAGCSYLLWFMVVSCCGWLCSLLLRLVVVSCSGWFLLQFLVIRQNNIFNGVKMCTFTFLPYYNFYNNHNSVQTCLILITYTSESQTNIGEIYIYMFRTKNYLCDNMHIYLKSLLFLCCAAMLLCY